ncbi:MAG TPA: GrpB family protein [Anaerolineae bacterium]|nr:GrpB family protein [Anaerolineae bacterium]
MIGLERDTVRLVPYQAGWARLYGAEKARLQGAVGDHVLDIQHVGSTAIPGIVAKPILDIAVAVHSFEAAYVCVAPIEALGYEYKGENGIPRRHYFVRRDPKTAQTIVHLHMNELGGPDWENQVLFRDYMLAHPEAAAEYTALKRGLAAQFPRDREAYTDGKAPFIECILRLARAETTRGPARDPSRQPPSKAEATSPG